MNRRLTGSLIGFAAIVSFSAPAYPAERNPIFAKAHLTINTGKANKAVSGKGYYADYYGYYGNLYNSYAGIYGNEGSYYKNYSYYYTAYTYSNYASNDYYNAYYYQLHGQ